VTDAEGMGATAMDVRWVEDVTDAEGMGATAMDVRRVEDVTDAEGMGATAMDVRCWRRKCAEGGDTFSICDQVAETKTVPLMLKSGMFSSPLLLGEWITADH